MQELLEYIVKALVSKPEVVEVETSEADDTLQFTIKADQEDLGLIIGKAGQTIKAIRKILICRAQAENTQMRVNVDVKAQA